MTPRAWAVVAFVALLSCLVSMLNWGLSLVFSGLLARAIARRSDLRTDYRALGAAAYLGLGAVWALGLSSSAAQLQATPASLPPELLEHFLEDVVGQYADRADTPSALVEVVFPDGRQRSWELTADSATSPAVGGAAADVLAWLIGRHSGARLNGTAPTLPKWL